MDDPLFFNIVTRVRKLDQGLYMILIIWMVYIPAQVLLSELIVKYLCDQLLCICD